VRSRLALDDPPEPAADEISSLPSEWRSAVRAKLGPGERVVTWFAPDLDEQLHFAEGLVLLTDRRLLAAEEQAPRGRRGEVSWSEWGLPGGGSLTLRDRAGLGSLDLSGPHGRLANWRFTLARAAGAHRLVERYSAHGRPAAPEAEEPEETHCPSCGEPIPAGLPGCPQCAPSESAPTTTSLLRLARFARPRFWPIALGFFLTLTSTAVSLIPPGLTVPLFDEVLIPGKDYYKAKWYLLGFLAASVLAWLLSWARTYVLAWVSERISADMRVVTYEHLQKLSLEYFGGKRTGDLMSRISTDTDRICNFLSMNLLDFATDLIMIVMTAAILVRWDPWLSLMTLVPFPLIAWLVFLVRSHLRRSLDRGGRAWSEMTSVLADTIPGIRVVKAFAQESREVERFRQSNDHVLEANDRVNTTWSFFGPIVTLLTQIGLLIVWAFGTWEVYRGYITVGVLLGFNQYISRFYLRIESLIRMVQATQRVAASTQRIFAILDRTPSVAEPARPVATQKMRGEIEFRNVSFRHGSRQILDGISLHVRPGEMIGLVGPSGAGKSTLVNLVCRFYDVADGAILADGVDIRSYRIADYRRNIGIVLQEPFLFYGTIAENIAYGRPSATRHEIIAASRAARCHEFILRLPDAYDSLVGERGQALSGGERQRISIARALLIDPRILILDEATSSVDTETEREIQEALDNLIRGRTTIAIAHRLSTLRKADRLVVLEKGRVVEVGGHQDLLDAEGVYARLHRAQAELAAGSTP
jgi:ATP-binding cassette subfamily B protein